MRRVGLAALVCVFLGCWLTSCRCDEIEVPDAPVEPRPEEEPEPPYEEYGTVCTILTRVGRTAPAATLEHIAALEVELTATSGEAVRTIIAMGGSAMLALPEVSDNGIVQVRVLSPSREVVGFNSISITELGGTFGVLSFEVGPVGEYRGCIRCTTPELFSDLYVLTDTAVHWSSNMSRIVDEQATLDAAFRSAVSMAEREQLVSNAGGEIVETRTADEQGLVWLQIASTGSSTTMDVGLRLAALAEVKAIELYEEGRSGVFWLDL